MICSAVTFSSRHLLTSLGLQHAEILSLNLPTFNGGTSLSPARGPPTDWGEIVQADDDRASFRASPDDLPHDRYSKRLSGAGRNPRMSGNCELGRGLRSCEKRHRRGFGAFRETRFGRLGRSSRGSGVAHQPVDPCGSAIDRAILVGSTAGPSGQGRRTRNHLCRVLIDLLKGKVDVPTLGNLCPICKSAPQERGTFYLLPLARLWVAHSIWQLARSLAPPFDQAPTWSASISFSE